MFYVKLCIWYIFLLLALFAQGELTYAADIEAVNSVKSEQLDDDSEFDLGLDDKKSEIYDPWEKYNRKVFAFNEVFDKAITRNVALAYEKGVPKSIRSSVRNFLVHVTSPIALLNSALQGKMENTMATFSRFLINTTIGLGGLFDVAVDKGIKSNSENFSQTMGFYGVGSGAYLVLPILGPSSTRDFLGFAVDKGIDPLGFNVLRIGGANELFEAEVLLSLALVGGIDKRESLLDIVDDVRKESFDPYATMRSFYLQNQQSQIER